MVATGVWLSADAGLLLWHTDDGSGICACFDRSGDIAIEGQKSRIRAAGRVRPDVCPELPAGTMQGGARGASGVGLGEGCRRNRVLGCEVFDAGGHGIHVGMAHGPVCAEDFAWKGEEDELQANEISNCYVHHTGQMDWGAYGIFSSYCQGSRITHNLVEQLPYSGICASFSMAVFPTKRDDQVTVEYNHVHHVILTMGDAGGIYTKDGVSKSSAIRGNLIHDIGGNTPGNNGIFLDDGTYGFHLEDNMVRDVRVSGPVQLDYSREVYLGKKLFWCARCSACVAGRQNHLAIDTSTNWYGLSARVDGKSGTGRALQKSVARQTKPLAHQFEHILP